MKRLPIFQIDAFADTPFTGNPAAVLPLDAWPEDKLLQNIAMENNLSETAFLVADESGEADYELRWFTPTVEVVLCGHATLASGHFILSREPDRQKVTFRTRKAGLLSVERKDGRYALSLPVWKPSPKPLPDIVAALGLADDQIEATLWNENDYGLVVVKDAAAIAALEPDHRALADLGDVLAIVTAPGDDTDIVSRVFAAGAGVEEDPVTGSAHAVSVPYWADRLGRDHVTAYQASERGGYLDCTLAGDRVVLGGACVTVMEGSLLLPA